MLPSMNTPQSPPMTAELIALVAKRARHRRLLAGAADEYLTAYRPNLNGPKPMFPGEAELRLRKLADGALDNDLVHHLERRLAYRTRRDLGRYLAGAESCWSRPIEDLLGPIDHTVAEAPTPDPTRLRQFVSAAVVADLLAGDYSDPRITRAPT